MGNILRGGTLVAQPDDPYAVRFGADGEAIEPIPVGVSPATYAARGTARVAASALASWARMVRSVCNLST